MNNKKSNKRLKISKKIPKALREQVWIKFIGKKYDDKCTSVWCTNNINVFDFHVGHNIPDSKGGLKLLENLRPICSRCNLSMSNNYSIEEWCKMGKDSDKTYWWMCC